MNVQLTGEQEVFGRDTLQAGSILLARGRSHVCLFWRYESMQGHAEHSLGVLTPGAPPWSAVLPRMVRHRPCTARSYDRRSYATIWPLACGL